MGGEKYINVRVSEHDFRALQKLVEDHVFMSISDAVRTAIRKLIYEHQRIVENRRNGSSFVDADADAEILEGSE